MEVMSEGEKVFIEENVTVGGSMGAYRLAAICCGAVAIIAIGTVVWMATLLSARHPYVVRIEPDGRYEPVVEGDNFKRQPQEVKWFIQQFCAHYFSRDRLTIQELPKTIYYFAPNVRSEIENSWKQAKVIENVLSNSSGTQVDAVAMTPQLSRSGNEAYVQVRLDRRINGERAEGSPVANTYIRFECLACEGKPVPDDMVSTNPLGFRIQNIPFLEAAK